MNINYYIILKFSTNELMIDDLIMTIVNKVKLQSSTHMTQPWAGATQTYILYMII